MWILWSLMSMIFWGLEDVFVKVSSEDSDDNFHLKIAVDFGIMAIPLLFLVSGKSESGASIANLLTENISATAAIIIYIIVMIISYIGAKYMDISVYTPIADASSGFSVLMIIFFLIITGSINSSSIYLSPACITGMLLSIIGVFFLASSQNHSYVQKEPSDNKFSKGALAFLFPLSFCIMDAVSTFIDSINMGAEGEAEIGSLDYTRIYLVEYLIAGIISWIIILFKTRKPYFPHKKNDIKFFTIGFCETVASLTYIFALDKSAVLTVPIANSYSVVTLLVSHIFLKERLKISQYICIAMVIAGIFIISFLGIFE